MGDKNFGLNNGLFYNYSKSNFCNQRAKVAKINLLRNEELKSQWGEKFIDLIDLFIDKNNTVPVFTTDCKFISNDTRHLTEAGAIFFAKKVNPQLKKIFNETNHTRP